MAFQGFSPQAMDFLWGIRLDPTKGYYEPRRAEYRRFIVEPMAQLGQQLLERLQAAQVLAEPVEYHQSRIYRDARRLRGRPMYRDHVWFLLRRFEQSQYYPAYYFELSPDGCSFGFGYGEPQPGLMARFRQRLQRQPDEFRAVLQASAQGTLMLGAEQYRKKFAGEVTADLMPWYQAKEIWCHQSLPASELLFTSELGELVCEACVAAGPLFRYFWQMHD